MKNLNRWVYAIVGVITLLVAGLIYAWTVFAKTVSANHVDWSAASVSLTFTLVMAFFCLGGLIAGILSKKVKPRIYVLISAVLFLVGFLIASMTGENIAPLYIGFGVFCGLGAGFSYNAVMGTISAWFPDKQGLISGILLMGFGFSSFIVGKIFAFVAPADGSGTWTGVFRVMAIVVCVILAICSFFFVRPGSDFKPPAPKKEKAVREPACDINTGQMVRRPVFWLIYIWAIMVSAAGLALVGQASGIATQVGPQVESGTIATVVGLISIMNGIGRVIYGAIYDKKGYKPTMILCKVSFIICALILIAAIQSQSFGVLVLGFVVGGFAYGGVTPVQSAIISDFFGRTYYATNFSIIVTNLLIGSFASTIAGKLYDMSQSYMSTVFMMIIVTVIGFVIFLGIRRPKDSDTRAA